MKETSLKPIITKLESLFSKFNQHFYKNELQSPIITISPDTTKGAYGWCTSWRAWSNQKNENSSDLMTEGYYEINICAEYLSRPFEQICETLLHEMVHLYNLQIDVQDTSRSGTYHNKKYKEAAEQHGLTVEQDAKYGWARTRLNDDARYFIGNLQDKKFQLYRKKLPKTSATKGKQSTRKYICPVCGCIVRATKNVSIICADCNVMFEKEEE